MKVIFRYRTSKPEDGHFSFQLHANAQVLSYAEHWHTEKGWEVLVDALEETREPKERRYFFLCNAGDNLDFLGENPDLYFVGKHDSKSYSSFVFETTHLSETERLAGRIEASRYVRRRPEFTDMSRTEQARVRREQSRRHPVVPPPAAPPPPVEPVPVEPVVEPPPAEEETEAA